jgi:hypothetical protein
MADHGENPTMDERADDGLDAKLPSDDELPSIISKVDEQVQDDMAGRLDTIFKAPAYIYKFLADYDPASYDARHSVDGTVDRVLKRKGKFPGAIFIHAGAGFHSEQNEHMHLEACSEYVSLGPVVLCRSR